MMPLQLAIVNACLVITKHTIALLIVQFDHRLVTLQEKESETTDVKIVISPKRKPTRFLHETVVAHHRVVVARMDPVVVLAVAAALAGVDLVVVVQAVVGRVIYCKWKGEGS